MSNALAVPTVTASITTLLQARLAAASQEFGTPVPLVAPGPLDDGGAGDTTPRVGVHLYRVSRNAARCNEDLPTRTGEGTLRSRPRAALDLHYLLSFRGDGQNLYLADQMLAVCAATLHATTDLAPELIAQATADHREIRGNDLARADERVRITPEAPTLDEVSKLWALYQPGVFTVTLAFVAGPVLVEFDEVPHTVLPVRHVASGARPFSSPRLDSVAGPEGVGAPVRSTSGPWDLRLLGAGLSALPGETLQVLLDGVALPSGSVTVVDSGHLTVRLSGPAPGRHTIQVERLTAPLDPALSSTRPALASDVLPFVVLPTLVTVHATPASGGGDYSGTLTIDFLPAIATPQRARLLLDRTQPDTTVALALDVTLGSSPVTSADIHLTHEPRGTYRVTFEVDGARSLPPLDAQGRYVPQEVTL